MADSPLSTSPRTMKVKDFKACVVGMVEICSLDESEVYYHGFISDIPFVYLYCWISDLSIGISRDKNFPDAVFAFFVIRLHS